MSVGSHLKSGYVYRNASEKRIIVGPLPAGTEISTAEDERLKNLFSGLNELLASREVCLDFLQMDSGNQIVVWVENVEKS